MNDQKELTTYKIDPDSAFWRAVIGLVCLLLFLIFHWSIALFLSGFFLGMSLVLKSWTSQFEVVLIKKRKNNDD